MTSASGVTLNAAGAILDDQGQLWSISQDGKGWPLLNGKQAGGGYDAALLLWYSGTIYHQNKKGEWYAWSNTTKAWSAAKDPRPQTAPPAPVVPPAKLFYGMNGHTGYNSGIWNTLKPEQVVAYLKDLGCTVYRSDVAGTGMAQILAGVIKGAMKGSGIEVQPVLNPRSARWDLSLSEKDSYAIGYKLATDVMTVLKGLVKYVECGNECDTTGLKIAGAGQHFSDWDPKTWGAFRGVSQGMIDGVKAIDPTVKVSVNVGIPLGYGALQMLWNGITPDGTPQGKPGAKPMRWDYTSYHWYKSSYNIERAGKVGENINVLQILKDSFNVPIWITECGWSGAQDTPDSAAQYVTQMLTQYLAAKDKYNVQCIMPYCLVDKNYGYIQDDGVTKNPAYQTLKDFIHAHPV